MKDQTQILNNLNINAVMITGKTPLKTQTKIWKDIIDNNENAAKILYLTPEKIAKSKRVKAYITKAYGANRLNRFVIDEAHCCSQYGHDFRTDYRELSCLRTLCDSVPIFACTATATPKVRNDIIQLLRMKDPKVFQLPFNRPNLYYSVRLSLKSPNATSFIHDIALEIHSKYKNQYGIVYCLSQKDTAKYAKELREYGIASRAYNAGLSDAEKDEIFEKWSMQTGEIYVVVGTIALGMGIDHQFVRFVYHQCLSKSLIGYYQESGRAGRDLQPADCILYYDPFETSRLASMVYESYNGLLYLGEMLSYCENMQICRREIIAHYFEENIEENRCNGKCDVCSREIKCEVVDVTEIVGRLLEYLSSGQYVSNLTIHQFCDSWRGNTAHKFPKEYQIDKKEFSKLDCARLVIRLLVENILIFEFVATHFSVNVYIQKKSDAVRKLERIKPILYYKTQVVHAKPPKRKLPEPAVKKTKSRIFKDDEDFY